MPCCEISNCAQTSKTIIAVRHFVLDGLESLETAVSHIRVDMSVHSSMKTMVRFDQC